MAASEPNPARARSPAGLRGRAGLLLLALRLAQLDAPDLPGERLRQVVHELDLARVRVRRVAVAHEALDLVGKVVRAVVALAQDDEGLDDVAALGVRRRNRGGLQHSRVLDARRLDLER